MPNLMRAAYLLNNFLNGVLFEIREKKEKEKEKRSERGWTTVETARAQGPWSPVLFQAHSPSLDSALGWW